MKVISAIIGVIILLYLSIKHNQHDLFNNQEEIPGFFKNRDDHSRNH